MRFLVSFLFVFSFFILSSCGGSNGDAVSVEEPNPTDVSVDFNGRSSVWEDVNVSELDADMRLDGGSSFQVLGTPAPTPVTRLNSNRIDRPSGNSIVVDSFNVTGDVVESEVAISLSLDPSEIYKVSIFKIYVNNNSIFRINRKIYTQLASSDIRFLDTTEFLGNTFYFVVKVFVDDSRYYSLRTDFMRVSDEDVRDFAFTSLSDFDCQYMTGASENGVVASWVLDFYEPVSDLEYEISVYSREDGSQSQASLRDRYVGVSDVPAEKKAMSYVSSAEFGDDLHYRCKLTIRAPRESFRYARLVQSTDWLELTPRFTSASVEGLLSLISALGEYEFRFANQAPSADPSASSAFFTYEDSDVETVVSGDVTEYRLKKLYYPLSDRFFFPNPENPFGNIALTRFVNTKLGTDALLFNFPAFSRGAVVGFEVYGSGLIGGDVGLLFREARTRTTVSNGRFVQNNTFLEVDIVDNRVDSIAYAYSQGQEFTAGQFTFRTKRLPINSFLAPRRIVDRGSDGVSALLPVFQLKDDETIPDPFLTTFEEAPIGLVEYDLRLRMRVEGGLMEPSFYSFLPYQ